MTVACGAQDRQQEHHGHDGDVLKKQDAGGEPSMGRIEFGPVGIHLQHDGGAAEGRKKSEKDGLVQWVVERYCNARYCRNGQQNLGYPACQELASRPQNVGNGKFKPHREQKKDYADIGKALDDMDLGDDRRSIGSDEDSRDQESDESRQFGAVKKVGYGKRNSEDDDQLAKDVDFLFRHGRYNSIKNGEIIAKAGVCDRNIQLPER